MEGQQRKQKFTKVFPAEASEKPSPHAGKANNPQKPQKDHQDDAFSRGAPIKLREIRDRKLKGSLSSNETKIRSASRAAADTRLLLTEDAGSLVAEGMEKTYKFKQEDIVKNVDLSSARKNFDLKFDNFGPYHMNYTRNGRHILIGGKKGHIGSFDWQTGKLGCEIHLGETVRDVQWLHNETMFAVAQRKYVFVYDDKGTELHKLQNHLEPNRLEFLPYHFLLTSIGTAGYLRYHDTSTGSLLTEIRTKLGPCEVMTQNPHNAIIHLGHSNGTVTFWSPNLQTPLVKMLCHTGPVKAVAIDPTGHYMASTGLDGLLKVWDVRTYKSLFSYATRTPASTLAISQKGMLAVGYGPHTQIWQNPFREKQQSPYLNHLIPGSTVTDLQFCPFEDVLGIGHTKGFTSILVPGSGEPNIDALEINPFQTKKQRNEAEVKHLLEKINHELIALDPNFVGGVRTTENEKAAANDRADFEANNPGKEFKPRNKARGRNTSVKKYLRKRKNVVDQKRLDIQADNEKRAQKRDREDRDDDHHGGGDPLARFTKKPKF